MQRWLKIVSLGAVLTTAGLWPSPADAQEPEGPSIARGPAAFLFAYEVKDGMRSQFEDGYRRHLEWHREHRDPLPWYGWYVTSGERPGLFIDGTFGIPFRAFDERVEPAADFADMMETTLPYVTPVFYRTYRLRAELGTGQPLEDREPAGFVQVFHFAVSPGREAEFADWAGRLRELATGGGPGTGPVLTWYELVAGGEVPAFMLHISRTGWRDVGPGPGLVSTILGTGIDPSLADELTAGLAGLVRSIESEAWTYREDLSLFEP